MTTTPINDLSERREIIVFLDQIAKKMKKNNLDTPENLKSIAKLLLSDEWINDIKISDIKATLLHHNRALTDFVDLFASLLKPDVKQAILEDIVNELKKEKSKEEIMKVIWGRFLFPGQEIPEETFQNWLAEKDRKKIR